MHNRVKDNYLDNRLSKKIENCFNKRVIGPKIDCEEGGQIHMCVKCLSIS